MDSRIIHGVFPLVLLLVLAGCQREELVSVASDSGNNGPIPISLSGTIEQVYSTRANDSGFADGDEIGAYITDYDGQTASPLLDNGNRADNVKFTFDETSGKWVSQREIYWKDKHTDIDIYAYYPYLSVEKVGSMSFSVVQDQSTVASEGQLGGYESSDFLWGKAEDAKPTADAISIGFTHKMAGIRVSLLEGSGFTDGEWAAADKQVLILGLKHNAVVDLATGEINATGDENRFGITPYGSSDNWRAVVPPQQVEAGRDLIRISVGGYTYRFSRSEATSLTSGKLHNFTITVNKRAAGDYEFLPSGESITAWENDGISHDALTREYVIINVDEPGTLKECIEKSGRQLDRIRNLKLTGTITSSDFAVMRYDMANLHALNLKDVRIVADDAAGSTPSREYWACEDDQIPGMAFRQKTSLTSLILPDRLKKICSQAFYWCENISGALILPEGLEVVEGQAFCGCISLTSISFPRSLKMIGTPGYFYEYDYEAFSGCSGLSMELILPEGLEYIGPRSFAECSKLYGTLKLPSSLKGLGHGAFMECPGFRGNIEIPQGITKIEYETFYKCNFGGNLILHEGIEVIDHTAFAYAGLKGELNLPSCLESIAANSFRGNSFSGVLKIPARVMLIGEGAFADNGRLSGTVDFPSELLYIGTEAFSGCSDIEGLVFSPTLEFIGERAFSDCFGLNRIVCNGPEPPTVKSGAFDGVSKDDFTIEVPSSAIHQYQVASGWKDFKRIAAYRNFSVDPKVATAINTSVTRQFTLYADDDWEVESMPDWVTLNQTSGNGKTEMSVTFYELPSGEEPRTGEIVFNLSNKDYTTTLSLSQYDYEYAEDEILTLQSATKGKGVNLMFLGDGYNAKQVSEGVELKNIKTAVEHFFSIEPYKTYRDYFNVYTGVAVSAESGVGGVNTIVYNRFNTTAKGGVSLGGRDGDSDFATILQYACKAPTISEDNLGETLIVMIPNTTDYGGICYMYGNGCAIAYCPMSDYGYPLDFRGVVQHEAGGHGFGKLGDEYIYHNMFIDNCDCTCCGHVLEFNAAKANGWYDNLSLSGKTNEVPWSHLIYHEKYRDIVDIYEGGFMHSRGVFRSEYNSCMNKNIPYYSTISRESIVRRIKEYAGEEFSFDDFVANDKFDVNTETGTAIVSSLTKSGNAYEVGYPGGYPQHHEPVFLGDCPKL